MRQSFFHIPALFLLCFSVPTLGQESTRLTQENGDCTGAIPIPDSVYYQPSGVRAFGNKLEIKENPVDHTQWIEREHHTTWYKFRSPVTTKLTFDIIPDSVEDDIDFLVFEGAVPGICDKIASKQVQPIRSNISRNDKEMGSRCGLSADAPDQFVRSGIGASYSSAMEVKERDLFYLVIDSRTARKSWPGSWPSSPRNVYGRTGCRCMNKRGWGLRPRSPTSFSMGYKPSRPVA